MSRRTRRGSASDTSQQEGDPPADEVGEGGAEGEGVAADATSLILSKLAAITGQLGVSCALSLVAWSLQVLDARVASGVREIVVRLVRVRRQGFR